MRPEAKPGGDRGAISPRRSEDLAEVKSVAQNEYIFCLSGWGPEFATGLLVVELLPWTPAGQSRGEAPGSSEVLANYRVINLVSG